jgi:hypothetical protein
MFPPHFPSVTTDQLNGLGKTTDPKQPLSHQQQTKNLTESCELDTKVHNLDSGSRSVYSLGNKKKLETRNSPVHYQKMGRPQINVQNDSLQQSPRHHLHPPKHLLSLSPVQCALPLVSLSATQHRQDPLIPTFTPSCKLSSPGA